MGVPRQDQEERGEGSREEERREEQEKTLWITAAYILTNGDQHRPRAVPTTYSRKG